MKTYEINRVEELEQFITENGLEIDGNLVLRCSITVEKSILVKGYIKAGGSIKAGTSYGISAGLSISCKGALKFGLKCFAGICTWREITDEEKTITCGKFEGGVIAYGTLKEMGIKSDKVKITCEGKTVEISRESAIALNLIKED